MVSNPSEIQRKADAELCSKLVSRPTSGSNRSINATLVTPGSTESRVARVSYILGKEDGRITLYGSDTKLQISHRHLLGMWTVRTSDTVVTTAYKQKNWRRNFVLTFQGNSFVMTPTRAEDSDYELRSVRPGTRINGREVEGVLVCCLKANPEDGKNYSSYASYEYEVTFKESLEIGLVVFCFWLVILMNKRNGMATELPLITS